jgi:hypothetical protein
VDGETYLRLLVERVVDDVAQRPPVDMRDAGSRVSPFMRVSQALVAAGAVDGDVAGAIVSDLTLAVGLRTPHLPDGLEPRTAGPRQPAPMFAAGQRLPPLQRGVRGCEADVEVADGTLHVRYLVVDDNGAQLVGTALQRTGAGGPVGRRPLSGARPAVASSAPSPGLGVTSIRRTIAAGGSVGARAGVARPRPGGGQIPQFDNFTVTDQSGSELDVRNSSVSGGDDGWDLAFRLTPAPSASTTALLFHSKGHDPVRAQLAATVAARVGPVEEVPARERWNAAERYLLASAERSFQWWRRARAHGGVPTPPLEDTAVTALVEVGALAPNSAAITMCQALARAGLGEEPSSGLPDSWASILAHLADDDGHDATVVVGAVLPAIAGREVWVDALTSLPERWALHVFQRPGGWSPPGAGMPGGDLSYAATDDLGGAYVGFMHGGGGGSDGLTMRMAFLPRLDPAAAEVRLELSAAGLRTSVVVPLPWPWGGRG